MARSHFILIQKEWMHAMLLHGQCNATEYEVLMAVAMLSWGWNRKQVAMGMQDFRKYSGKSDAMISRALRVLSTAAGERVYEAPSQTQVGLGMLILMREATPRQSRVYRIEDDVASWHWAARRGATGDDRRRECVETMATMYPPTKHTEGGRRLALRLRDMCIEALGDRADVPDAQGYEFKRWCGSMDELVELHGADEVGKVITKAAFHPFWATQLLGRRADRALLAHYDRIIAA